MFSRFVESYKIRLIVSQVHRRIGVFDGEAERARKFRESGNIGGVVEELGKFSFEIVVTRNQIEDAFTSFPYRTRPGEGLARRQHPRRLEKLRRLLLDG